MIGMNSYADEVGTISVDINDSYGNAYTLSLWFGDYTNGIPDGLMQPTEIVQNTCLMLETALGEDIQSVLTDHHTEIRSFSYSPSDGENFV